MYLLGKEPDMGVGNGSQENNWFSMANKEPKGEV